MPIVDGIEHHGGQAFGTIRDGVGLLFGYAKPAGQ
jgi:class 3 adenylate cyclase